MRLQGYLSVTKTNINRHGEKDKIAATIRHNHARGKHDIAAISDIFRDLCRLGWSDRQIEEELGMDADEYSSAWTVE